MTMTLTAESETSTSNARKPISQKRLAANRANALKSTGPKTEDGKSSSRRNALKLGLTGSGVVLPEDMEQEVDEAVASFAARLLPVDDYDWRLVRQAAIGSVRFERLVQVQEANLLVRRNNATKDWDERRAAEVERLAALLEVDPDQAVRGLKRITEGADFLCDAWDALETRLQRVGFWSDDDLHRAVRLLGWNGLPTVDDAGPAVPLTFCALGLRPDRIDIADQAAAFFNIDAETALDLLASPEESLDSLLGAIQQHKADLRTLADSLWDRHDALDRATAPDRALVDLSLEGRRLHRYDQQASAQIYRALREIDARRRQADRSSSSGTTTYHAPSPAVPIVRPAAVPPAQNEAKPAEPDQPASQSSLTARFAERLANIANSTLDTVQNPETSPGHLQTPPLVRPDLGIETETETACESGQFANYR